MNLTEAVGYAQHHINTTPTLTGPVPRVGTAALGRADHVEGPPTPRPPTASSVCVEGRDYLVSR